MPIHDQEIESKFYVSNLGRVEQSLVALGAICRVPRGFEYNLRFDDPDNRLKSRHHVLRLRRSDDTRLTFKGPGEMRNGAILRTELELVVDDFETAQRFLEALGYQAMICYEKYRAMYAIDGALVTLDELPYGNFVEIEVEKLETIAAVAQKLGLRAEAAIPASYIGLFETARAYKKLPAKNLTFEEFKGVSISPADLGVSPAD
jgi:adenylate cyclase class 2